jgi:hypothetical protein
MKRRGLTVAAFVVGVLFAAQPAYADKSRNTGNAGNAGTLAMPEMHAMLEMNAARRTGGRQKH